MRHKQEDIREKGFSLIPSESIQPESIVDFSRMRVGLKNLDDATLNINAYKKVNSNYGDKTFIMDALYRHNYQALREISNLFFEASGIYSRLCKYIAYLYRYDWYIVPYVNENSSSVKKDKILKDFSNILSFYESSQISKLCGDIALSVIKNGCYYGYLSDSTNGIFLQELPVKYCRSRFNKDGFPTVEFNMKYFDDQFSDVQYRLRVISSFPKEFSKGYVLYRQGKLKPDFAGDTNGWYLLDPDKSVKFNCGGSDFPILVNAIPSIIDLNEAQALDRKKTMQKLLKIIIQKLPLDKNGDLVFDVDEAADIHNNAVVMLKNAIGTDVLTTFADIDVADLADKNTSTTTDDLSKVERGVYNEFGVSRNLFNAESNLALEKSILDDEASIRCLPQQFEAFFNKILNQFNTNPKKYKFKFKMLETTIYNYRELSKLYKEQTQLGYSKMLPQIALGHTQGEILAMAHFENEILNLTEIMIPPLMSSTMSSEQVLGNKQQKNTNNTQNNKTNVAATTEKKVGRPEKEDGEKSDKTIANKESM